MVGDGVRVVAPPLVAATAGATGIVAAVELGQGRFVPAALLLQLKTVLDNADGQLGLGSTSLVTSPTLIPGDFRYRRIAGGFYHTCAYTLAANAFCWGNNSEGRLGSGTGSSTSPVQVMTAASVVSAVAIWATSSAKNTESDPAASKGPVTIDVLTRSGVTSPTASSTRPSSSASRSCSRTRGSSSSR